MPASSSDDTESIALLRAEWIHLLTESLDRIRHCVSQLDDSQVWWRPDQELNSIGNLLLHLAGNLQQWGVDGVQQQPNDRQRDAEFQAGGELSREHLLAELSGVVESAKCVIADLPTDCVTARRRIQGFDVTVLGALMHTVAHFVGHTHQIVLLTRMQLGPKYRYHWTPEVPRDSVPL